MKVFVSILFVLLSISFAAEQVVYKYRTAGKELAQDADKESEDRPGKAENDDTKLSFHSVAAIELQVSVLVTNIPVSYYYAILLSGYSNKPYNPPDRC